MAKLTRKQLKEDRFVQEVGHQVEYVSEHRKQVIAAAVAAVVIIVGVAGYISYQRSQAQQARRDFAAAVRLFHGVVTTEQRIGYITFATTGERIRRTGEAFEKIRTDFSGRREAQAADYYLALLDIEQEKLDEAKAKLESAASASDETYASLARLTLADVLRRQGDIDAAKQQYQTLIDNPTSVVPAQRAKLEMARMLTDSDPQLATTLLEELMAEPGPAAAAAGQTLRKIRGS